MMVSTILITILISNERSKQCVLLVPNARRHFSWQVTHRFRRKSPCPNSVRSEHGVYATDPRLSVLQPPLNNISYHSMYTGFMTVNHVVGHESGSSLLFFVVVSVF
jgi:hypothetical protein